MTTFQAYDLMRAAAPAKAVVSIEMHLTSYRGEPPEAVYVGYIATQTVHALEEGKTPRQAAEATITLFEEKKARAL